MNQQLQTILNFINICLTKKKLLLLNRRRILEVNLPFLNSILKKPSGNWSRKEKQWQYKTGNWKLK